VTRLRRKTADGVAGILPVGPVGRQAITFMLNASLRNVSIRETPESPDSGRRSFQSKYGYDEKHPAR
jgi:hypothetical protein